MKKNRIFTVLLSTFVNFLTFAQDEAGKSEANNKSDLNDFIGKIIGTQAEVPKGSFIFDVSKSPEVKFNIPVNKDLYNLLYFDGKIASSNDFTPLVKSGDWLPDVGLSLNFTKFILTTTKYYTSEIDSKYNGDVNKANIKEASQLLWLWFNFKAGYNFSTLETYNGSTVLLNKEKFKKEDVNSFLIKTDLNIFFYPSKAHLKFLSFNGNIGYEHLSNDNNYNKLRSINVRETEVVTDTSGNSLEISQDTKKIKQGNLIVKNTSNINYNFMALFNTSENFYIGFSTFGKQTLTKDLKSLDVGFGITIPINKMKDSNKTLASITLKYEIPDVKNNFADIPIKEKGILGFSIGLPLNTHKGE